MFQRKQRCGIKMSRLKVDKRFWDFMDKLEGKEIGSSFKNFKKEAKMQGYTVTERKRKKTGVKQK